MVQDHDMSIATKIQWCDSTCNPTMGCEGCELWNPKTGERSCYAGVLHMRYGGGTKGFSPAFEGVAFWPRRMAAAARWRRPPGPRPADKPWVRRPPPPLLFRVGDERTIRFLSVEPQREQITLTKWLPRLDWLIQGGESGPNARTFELEWAVGLIGQCKTAGVAYFLKQLGRAVYAKGERL